MPFAGKCPRCGGSMEPRGNTGTIYTCPSCAVDVSSHCFTFDSYIQYAQDSAIGVPTYGTVDFRALSTTYDAQAGDTFQGPALARCPQCGSHPARSHKQLTMDEKTCFSCGRELVMV